MKNWHELNAIELKKAKAMADWLVANLAYHDDNSGPGVECRQDLYGHHSCYTCNLIEELLNAFGELQQRFGRGPSQRHGEEDG